MNTTKKIVDEKLVKQYERKMKSIGINSNSYPQYKTADTFGRQYRRTTIQKTARTTFSASL